MNGSQIGIDSNDVVLLDVETKQVETEGSNSSCFNLFSVLNPY
jgi:hypothetical protein